MTAPLPECQKGEQSEKDDTNNAEMTENKTWRKTIGRNKALQRAYWKKNQIKLQK